MALRVKVGRFKSKLRLVYKVDGLAIVLCFYLDDCYKKIYQCWLSGDLFRDLKDENLVSWSISDSKGFVVKKGLKK